MNNDRSSPSRSNAQQACRHEPDEDGNDRRHKAASDDSEMFPFSEHEQARAHLDALEQTLQKLERRIVERSRTLKLLYEIASAANRAGSADDAFHFVLRRVAEHHGWVFGHVFVPSEQDPKLLIPTDIAYARDPARFKGFRIGARRTRLQSDEGTVGRAYQTGQPAWLNGVQCDCEQNRDHVRQDLGIETVAAFPVLVGNEVVAVLEFFSDRTIQPDHYMLRSMASIGTQLGRVVERKRLERRIADFTNEQQRNIGLELHDSVAQQLTGVSLLAENIRQKLAAESSPTAEPAGRLVEYVRDAQRQVRRLSRGLRPVEVDALGLMSALEELAESNQAATGTKCAFECQQAVLVEDNTTATHLYRIAQEALQNAVRHAKPQNIVVRLQRRTNRVRLTIVDDGVGLPDDFEEVDGIGYRVMRYRARLIGAQLYVSSKNGHGTTVMCELRQDTPPPQTN